uniref:G_PROTEIN_RECEP_F1_2 domain-containing protein n=1 Tax=Ascaris lumbricoides TaxID=6252 RepID=A0A0M3HYZ1_ASCLU
MVHQRLFYFCENFSREMRTVSNMFIFNLALADLLFLAGVPIVVIQTITSEWIFGQAMCKAFISGNGINQFASAIFMGVLSLDRYLAVCYAIKSTKWRTPRFALILSIASWLAVTIEMVPLLKFAKLIRIYEDGSENSRCSCMLIWSDDLESTINDSDIINEITFSKRIFTTYSFSLSYMLPLVAIWYFYANIIARLWRLCTLSNNNLNKFQVTLMGLAIVISYTLCWMPFWIVTWSIELEANWVVSPLLVPLSYGAYALQYINSAVNPFLYVFLTDTFRQKLVRWRSKKRKCEIARQPSETTHMLPMAHAASPNAKFNANFRESIRRFIEEPSMKTDYFI